MRKGRKADNSGKGVDRQRLSTTQREEEGLKQMLASFDDLRYAVLATSDEGRPYTSLIAFALTPDFTTVIFATPRATRKYRNLRSQRSVSILIDNRSQTPDDLSRAEAVTLVGTAQPVRAGTRKEEYSKVLSDRHPRLTGFIDEPGTALVAMVIEQAIHVTRFQDVSAWTREA